MIEEAQDFIPIWMLLSARLRLPSARPSATALAIANVSSKSTTISAVR
jgi:hypothetical protein